MDILNYDKIKIELDELKKYSISQKMFEEILNNNSENIEIPLKIYQSHNYFFKLFIALNFFSIKNEKNIIYLKKEKEFLEIIKNNFIEVNGIEEISKRIFQIEEIPELYQVLFHMYNNKIYTKSFSLKLSFFDKMLEINKKKRMYIFNIAILYKLINRNKNSVYLNQIGIDFIKKYINITEKKKICKKLFQK